MKIFKTIIVSAFACALYFTPAVSKAQFQTDLRIGAFGNGSHLFIGGGFRTGLSNSIYINPTVNYAFVNKSGILFVDIDGHYDFPVTAVHLYAGPGLGLYLQDSKTTVQLNLLVGVGFKNLGIGFEPYIQPKFVISGESRFLQLGFGGRF